MPIPLYHATLLCENKSYAGSNGSLACRRSFTELPSGGVAAWGAWYAVRSGVRDLEGTERRRQQIGWVINLYGLRYVLSPDPVQRDEDRTRFMFEIGRAGALFADDTEAQKKLRDFYSAIAAQSTLRTEIAAQQAVGRVNPQDSARLETSLSQSVALLVSLIKELSRSARFSVESLSDSEVREMFTMNLVNPSGISGCSYVFDSTARSNQRHTLAIACSQGRA